jgi:hypothetical protein
LTLEPLGRRPLRGLGDAGVWRLRASTNPV